MHMNVLKWGDSLGVRIPRVLANKIGIHVGSPVDVSLQEQHIVISKAYSLQLMLDQMTEENTHSEIQVGPACGKEVW